MTEALWFAVVAVLALAGWMLTLAMLTRTLLPMANALAVCQKIVDREDTKVASLVERVMRKREPNQPPANTTRRPDEQPANPMNIFGALEPTMPIDEQPDPDGLEIREA